MLSGPILECHSMVVDDSLKSTSCDVTFGYQICGIYGVSYRLCVGILHAINLYVDFSLGTLRYDPAGCAQGCHP